MASIDDNSDFSRIADDAQTLERERRRALDAHMRASGADVLDLGSSLLTLMQRLPIAMIEANRAEHERLSALYGDDHPRTVAVQTLAKNLDDFERIGALGRARAERAIEAIGRPGAMFSGFVSDSQGAPLVGGRVRLDAPNAKQPLEARIDSDGYFHMPLASATPGGRLFGKPRVGAATAARAKASAKAGVAPDAAPIPPTLADVTILDLSGHAIHDDPFGVPIDQGSVYREYVIDRTADAADAKAKRAAANAARRAAAAKKAKKKRG